jgi:hemerythrin
MTDSNMPDYPSLVDIAVVVKIMLKALPNDHEIDIDELVYDAISYWDEHFKNNEEWLSEEDTDIKDSLRDQFLEAINSN